MSIENTVFIGNYYEETFDSMVLSSSKKIVPFSSVNFNRKLVSAFDLNNKKISILSPIYFGSFPNHSSNFYVKKYRLERGDYTVPYLNVAYINQFSKTLMLTKRIRSISSCNLIIVSEIHIPYLIAAIKLKKKTKAKILLCVLDLPQYMSFQTKSILYKVLKQHSLTTINKLLKNIDFFYFLNEGMKVINTLNKPYIVKEGITSDYNHNYKTNDKYFLYSGSLEDAFNIKGMIESFIKASHINNNHFRLVICGTGSLKNFVEKACESNSQLVYLGLVSPSQVKQLQNDAFAFINPRMPIHPFTYFSFPSKNFEYLEQGKPTISYAFSANNKQLAEWFINPFEKSCNLEKTILRVMNFKESNLKQIYADSRILLKLFSPNSVFKEIEKLISKSS